MRAWPLFALAFVTMTSAIARADSSGDAAEALFRAGRKASAAGDLETACTKFAASQKIQPAPGTLLNLADCEEARGDLTSAWRDFIAVAGELADTDARKPVALERARRLERTMPKLRVRLLQSSIGARVWRDDVELVAAIGLAMPVAEGHHVVIVRESGHRAHAYDVVVGANSERDIEVQHGPRVGEATAGLVVGGVGAGALIVSATTGAWAIANYGSSNTECTSGVCLTSAAADQHRQAEAFAIVAGSALALGVALVVTGVVLLLWPHPPTRTILGAGLAF